MRPFVIIPVVALTMLMAGCDNQGRSSSMPELKYPETRRVDVAEDYHGTRVNDPYRWLENMDSDEVSGWVQAQNSVATPYLAAIPERERIIDRMTALWNYERYSVPFKEGGRYFYSRNDGLQNHDVMYVTEDLATPGRVLLDPNGFSEDGTVALSFAIPSPDGKYIAYAISDGGSDWRQWRVRDIETGDDLPDLLLHTKFTSVSWSRDSSGFYYSRYPIGNNGNSDDSKAVEVWYHTVGTSQDEDRHIYALPDHPRWNPYARVSEDGRYLIITVWDGYFANAVHYMTLDEGSAPAIELLADWDGVYEFLGNDDSVFYFQTTSESPNGRVIAIDVTHPERDAWRTVVPEQTEALQGAALIGGRVLTSYIKDARSEVVIYDLHGQRERVVELPGVGSVSGFKGKQNDPETFFGFTGFTTPSEVYRYNLETNERELFRRARVNADLDAYETRQVFYASKDGTRVPMFIVHRKGVELDGANPTLLYGYGGFNVSLTPSFSTSRMVWLEMGGVIAIANLRGGGEYGESWHKAGTKLQKQNVFDDFIAAAEYLVDNKYTQPQKLAVQGGSNGGLLVGAVLNQRPDLFGAALPAVGVLDMLRYHLPSANARAWSSDYGLSENPDEFKAMHAYSPYHNVRDDVCYPSTLITTGDHDDRVVPWHSYKYAAAMQAAQRRQADCANPVLISVETRAGHGAGKPTWMVIENIADQWAFLAKALDMNVEF